MNDYSVQEFLNNFWKVFNAALPIFIVIPLGFVMLYFILRLFGIKKPGELITKAIIAVFDLPGKLINRISSNDEE